VLHKHLSCEVAAGIVKHQKGVSALAQVGEGLKRELWHAEAAQVEACIAGERRFRLFTRCKKHSITTTSQ
jgi:predicted GIY-YIG superfamily endonuclease